MRVGLQARFASDPRFVKVTWEFASSYYGININHDREKGELSLNLIGKVNKLFADHPILAKLNGNRTRANGN